MPASVENGSNVSVQAETAGSKSPEAILEQIAAFYRSRIIAGKHDRFVPVKSVVIGETQVNDSPKISLAVDGFSASGAARHDVLTPIGVDNNGEEIDVTGEDGSTLAFHIDGEIVYTPKILDQDTIFSAPRR